MLCQNNSKRVNNNLKNSAKKLQRNCLDPSTVMSYNGLVKVQSLIQVDYIFKRCFTFAKCVEVVETNNKTEMVRQNIDSGGLIPVSVTLPDFYIKIF